MLKLRQGTDILSALGGIATIDEARALFAASMDRENLDKLGRIRQEEALLKIANAISLGRPDKVFVHSGSDADRQAVRRIAIEKGEERPLPMKDHTIHFDLEQEQARIIDRTFYIVNEDDPVSSLSKKVTRQEGLEYVRRVMGGMMRGMTLIAGFYSRGPVGARGSVPALEITTSAYVAHSADLLYRGCFDAFDAEVARRGYFFTNVHSEGPNRTEDLPAARVFMDRSWLTTYSMLCTYAGNTLLLKKGNHRFAVDLATYHQAGSELSEHMFITGLRGPGDRLTFIAGAAPSGCGKTTTAMVGTDFIGDDLAQLWIAEDGTLRAVNPERGIFGIVEDVNREGDPHLMQCLREEGVEVIWSNVLIDGSGTPRWVGDGDPPPSGGVNFTGDWRPGKVDGAGAPVPISHPNARCTLSNDGIANYNPILAEDPAGVPCRVITYSGRDGDTMPPVWVARSADEGVALGASIVSQATATEVGATGVRRQPWANQPFIPGNLGDYMEAQFRFFNSKRFSDAGRPLIAGLNYFLTHGARGGKGSGLLGEKRDVHVWLGWLERRANGEVGAIETPIGSIPRYEDLEALFRSKIAKEYPRGLYDRQFSLYVDNICARIDMQRQAWGREPGIPPRLFEVYDRQLAGLAALKAAHGPVISPAKLGDIG
jgi:phosphoenolpyruvate carboxykinase (GTP)